MNYILYNPKSGNGDSFSSAKKLINNDNDATMIDITGIESYSEFFSSMKESDCITVCGGDGTLNVFANEIHKCGFAGKVYYLPTGTGNDFYSDVCEDDGKHSIEVTEYIKELPVVKVNGKEYRFINGVGYGIDGYCCEVGDVIKSKGKVPNYTSIAITGLLFKFKPRNAVVTVDGVESEYKKVWIAPTMFGRHYGGGMIPTPNQNRCGVPKKLSLMMFHGSGKLKTLMIFPSIFKGTHINHTDCVKVVEGNTITVKFDKPTALQVDGETILGVTEYTARI